MMKNVYIIISQYVGINNTLYNGKSERKSGRGMDSAWWEQCGIRGPSILVNNRTRYSGR